MKTEVMHFEKSKQEVVFTLNDEVLEQVYELVYLGTIFFEYGKLAKKSLKNEERKVTR